MFKKISQIILLFVLLSSVIPNLVFASWWNPFTWSWFRKSVKIETTQIATTTTPTTTSVTKGTKEIILTSNGSSTIKTVPEIKKDESNSSKDFINSSLKLVAYKGEIYSAKIPEDWKVTESISGLNITNPDDINTGVFLIALPQAPGKSSPDDFLKTVISWAGFVDVNYISESDEKVTTIEQAPPLSNFIWTEKSKIFTCAKSNSSLKLKMKAITGVVNIYGTYSAITQGFITSINDWNKWAPLLERVTSSIIIVNPQKVGGKDKVMLPKAKDLANDSSPLMDAWEYRNKSQDRVQDNSSHELSDATMGVETDLVSPTTGRTYEQPLSNYDPTKGGYHNPDNYSEILQDLYE